MSAAENKKLLQHIFAELANGNSSPLIEAMADEFSWTITGATPWSRKYVGKQAVLKELFGALHAKLAPSITTTAHRIIAEDDYVVVEARGKNTTRDGVPYNNTYCYVFRLAGGRLLEMTEYLDTELVSSALGAPPSAATQR